MSGRWRALLLLAGLPLKIEARDLSHSFSLSRRNRHAVLDRVSFRIESGCFMVILGESGCGKSTLLNLLAGLMTPTAGQILANDTPLNGPTPDLSILFQQPSLLPWLTVADNIAFGCRLRGEVDGLREKVDGLIRMIGLAGFEDLYPAELSVGMAQRVCLARALIGQPRALLLDEPFGALDICNRTRLQDELIQIWRQRRFTAVLVTHDIDEALVVAERIIVLGKHPATALAEYEVDLPYPRDIASHSFFEARSQVIQLLRAATTHTHPVPALP